MSSNGAGKSVVSDVIETRLSGSAFQILAAATGKSSAVERRKSEGWYDETVCARGAQRTPTRHISNAVEWSQIPGRDATENFVWSARRSCILLAPGPAANEGILAVAAPGFGGWGASGVATCTVGGPTFT